MNYLVIAIAALILAGLSYLGYILLFNKEKITDTGGVPVPDDLQHCFPTPGRDMRSADHVREYWLVQNGGGTSNSPSYTLLEPDDYQPGESSENAYHPDGALTCTPTSQMNADCVGWNAAGSCLRAGGSVTGEINGKTVNITQVGRN